MINKNHIPLEKLQSYNAPKGIIPARVFVGIAVAGFASPATELLGDTITIDDYLVEHPSSTVLVKVSGESMIGACISDGDMLVVERNATPAVNSIVVAMVDGEFTIKYLRKDAQGMYLEAANDAFPIIRPEMTLEIYGEMVGLFRKTN
ncbi:MAG: S24 family peptidase [Ghiorsea sp.]